MAAVEPGSTPAARPRPPRSARAAVRLVAGLAGVITAGTLLLLLPGTSTRPLSPSEAFFTAVSALTTTGLSVITPGRDLTPLGQVVLLVLMQVGGIGIMVGAAVIFRLLGRRLTLEERLSLVDVYGSLSTDAVLRLTGRVLAAVLGLEGLGALILWANWRGAYGGRAPFLAVFHAVAGLTNASFDLFSGAPDAPAGFPQDALTLLTLSLLVITGSLGIPVLADLARHFPGAARPRPLRLALHTRLTLVTSGLLLAAGTLLLFVGQSRPGALFSDRAWTYRLLLAWFHSATSRTSGFVLEPLAGMLPANVLVLTLLMFIGGAPASMAGGITTSTASVLVLAMWAYARRRPAVVAGGRTIPQETVIKAVAILVVSLALVLAVTWLLLITQPASLSEALFESVSAFATSGFTLGLTPRLTLFGRVLIALTMFWGRVGALTIVVALAQRAPPPAVAYPEEPLLIG